jgi:hypothetical protein
MSWTRIAIIVIGSVWFFPVSCTTGLFAGTRLIAQLDARNVVKGEAVHSGFSVVIESESKNQPFYVLGLHELARTEDMQESSATMSADSYLMSRRSGHLESASSDFSYQVIEETASGQVIEVVETYHDGDNTIWSRYEATDSGITPISSRMFYFGYMFAAFPYAIGIACLLYVVGRYFRHRNKQPVQTNSNL